MNIKECIACKKQFNPKRKNAKFCSDLCKQSICFKCKKSTNGLKYSCAPCKKIESRKCYLKRTSSLKCYYCPKEIPRIADRDLRSTYCSNICKFNSKVSKEENGCWNWKPGYAKKERLPLVGFQFTNKYKLNPKRASLQLFKDRDIKLSIHVKNNCHNGLCVNPDHLYTLSSNIEKFDSKQCNTCLTIFNENNIVIDQSKKSGILPWCRTCYNQRSNLINKCINCKKELKKGSGRKIYCSIDCILEKNCDPSENGCWNWTSFTDRNRPYEVFNNKKINPKKLIYEKYHNTKVTLSGYGTKNSCGNISCISPKHIYISQVRPSSVPIKIREEIRDLYFNKNWTNKDLVEKFDSNYVTIFNAINYKFKDEIKIERSYLLLCSHCKKEFDNTESEFCSPICMQEFLIK